MEQVILQYISDVKNYERQIYELKLQIAQLQSAPIQAPTLTPLPKIIIKEKEELITYLSTDFFTNYFKPSTISTTRHYLKDLPEFATESQIDDWLEGCSNEAILRKLALLKKFENIYHNPLCDRHKTLVETLSEQRLLGVRQTKRTHKQINDEVNKISKLFESKLPAVNVWNLFGMYLPPRRLDVRLLHISEDYDNGYENQYVKQTNQLHFGLYKNSDRKGKEVFTLDSEDFPFISKENIKLAKQFLMAQSIGCLFQFSTNFSRDYKKHCNFNCGDFRHYWASKGKNDMSINHWNKLAKWQSHTIQTAVNNYVTQDDEESELDEELAKQFTM